jgi:hypothetical protein
MELKGSYGDYLGMILTTKSGAVEDRVDGSGLDIICFLRFVYWTLGAQSGSVR